jgi:hypothetical protein
MRKVNVDLINGITKVEKEHYDIIISNPPYGKIGNEITKCIVDNIDFNVFINLLPANDYRRFHKENALWQYVDINSMRTVQGGFADAAVTTMMCRISKNRAYYISEEEFEIQNYTDPMLHKYFYENRKRSHYAIDTQYTYVSIERAKKLTPEKDFIIGVRDISHGHMPYNTTNMQYRWNVEKSVDAEYLIENQGKHRSNKYDKNDFNGLTINAINFNTAKEKDNFTNFVYRYPEFINKIFSAVIADGAIKEGKVFPKVDWTKSWTPEQILKEYGYTEDEIKETLGE